MKKKPLVPRAQILWFPVLHQLIIPGLSRSHNSRRHRRGPAGAGCARGAPGRHSTRVSSHPSLAGVPGLRGLSPARSPSPRMPPQRSRGARPDLPQPRTAGGNRHRGTGGSVPGHRSVCGQREPGAAPPSTMARPDEAPGCGSAAGAGWLRARLPHSPGAGRGRGLDGADAEPVGRVLQRLQRLLVGLVIILHVGDAGGPRRLRVWGGGGWRVRGWALRGCGGAAHQGRALGRREQRGGGERSERAERGAAGSLHPPARPPRALRGPAAAPAPPAGAISPRGGGSGIRTPREWQQCDGWREPLEITPSDPRPRQGHHPEQLTQERVRVGLERLQRGRLHGSPGQLLFPCSAPLSVKSFSLMLRWNFMFHFRFGHFSCRVAGHH